MNSSDYFVLIGIVPIKDNLASFEKYIELIKVQLLAGSKNHSSPKNIRSDVIHTEHKWNSAMFWLASDTEHQENEDQSGIKMTLNFEHGSFSFTLRIIMLMLLWFMYIKLKDMDSVDC